MNNEGTITIEFKDKIATIEFYHPSSNSFPSYLLEELKLAFTTLSDNKTIQVIVLKSKGEGAFCAGASFDELLAVSDLESGTQFFSGFANVINAMRKCSKIIIGSVHGKAVGGGVGLVSACDYALATENASIKLSELAIGIGPFVIEPAVSRKIGKTAMSEITLAATEWKNAQWAVSKGLYSKIFASTSELEEEVKKLSSQLASYNPEALSEMKKVLWEGTENWEKLLYERAAISGKLVLSDFTKNALKAFKK